jgi:micrococcal nuclease
MMKKNQKIILLCIFCLITTYFLCGCADQGWQPSYDNSYSISVTEIIDGDTIQMILPSGEDGTLRFLGIDCPEKTAENNKADEYQGIINTSCLAVYGNKATDYLTTLIQGKDITISFESQSGFKDVYDRWLAIPSLANGTDINTLLLQKGYARTYTEGTCSKESLYQSLEQEAYLAKKGLWSCATPHIEKELFIQIVHYDAAGNDNNNLNDEYVIIAYEPTPPANAINLSGYYLKDRSENTYYFPLDTILSPGQSLTIYSGSGTDTADTFYWNNPQPIWGNDEDTAYLYDKTDKLIDSYSWTKHEQ